MYFLKNYKHHLSAGIFRSFHNCIGNLWTLSVCHEKSIWCINQLSVATSLFIATSDEDMRYILLHWNINFIPEQVSLIGTKSNIHFDWNLWLQSREEQHDLKQIYIDKIRKLNKTPGARDSWFENSSTIIENWVRCTWNFETWWNPRKSFRVIVNFEPSWVMLILMSLFH